ncbi:hypothetical protein EAI_11448 [Harpegnathos saltator]|uniref:Uncharacterized protein n=1 Tax=Harpegnathos saltator TaxID=610380 RepID=E2BS07_HARSA|nr:hypothetical protein EAI_11448 [Harpegnathos saltator]
MSRRMQINPTTRCSKLCTYARMRQSLFQALHAASARAQGTAGRGRETTVVVPPTPTHSPRMPPQGTYDLEAETLYTISWYKDNEEFYRYIPKAELTKHSYPVEGVKVDVSTKMSYRIPLWRSAIVSAPLRTSPAFLLSYEKSSVERNEA